MVKPLKFEIEIHSSGFSGRSGSLREKSSDADGSLEGVMWRDGDGDGDGGYAIDERRIGRYVSLYWRDGGTFNRDDGYDEM